jgi:hypothetical protein
MREREKSNRMYKPHAEQIFVFILGMLTFAIGSWFLSTFIFVERPAKGSIIEDWDQICFRQDPDGIYTTISPQGCYSSSCTRTQLQTSSAVIDLQNQEIHLDAGFVLGKTSRFPLPCTENCLGGNVQVKLDRLVPNDYEVWFRENKVGEIKIFSGRPTPKQCFEKN